MTVNTYSGNQVWRTDELIVAVYRMHDADADGDANAGRVAG